MMFSLLISMAQNIKMISDFDEIIISEVGENGRFIYDTCPTVYLNIEGRRNSFFEGVAAVLKKQLNKNVTGEEVGNRWSLLRSNFTRNDLKLANCQKLSQNVEKYYNRLMFLKKFVIHRQGETSIYLPKSSDEEFQGNSILDVNNEINFTVNKSKPVEPVLPIRQPKSIMHTRKPYKPIRLTGPSKILIERTEVPLNSIQRQEKFDAPNKKQNQQNENFNANFPRKRKPQKINNILEEFKKTMDKSCEISREQRILTSEILQLPKDKQRSCLINLLKIVHNFKKNE